MTDMHDFLLDEVWQVLRSIQRDLDERPSGVSKSKMRERLALAEGALRAVAVSEGRMTSFEPGTAILGRDSADDSLYYLVAKRIELSHKLQKISAPRRRARS